MRRSTFKWITGAVTLIGLLLAGVPKQTHAHTPSGPYSFLMTAEMVEKITAAWNDQLEYIPGEVLVKFKPGTTEVRQIRALSTLRGFTDVAQSRRIGDAMIVPTIDEPNAEGAAEALRR